MAKQSPFTKALSKKGKMPQTMAKVDTSAIPSYLRRDKGKKK